MVSEATVQAKAEQLQDYRELLGERRRRRIRLQTLRSHVTRLSLCSRNSRAAGQ